MVKPYIVEKRYCDTARPYMVIFTLRRYNRVKGLYATRKAAQNRANKLNRLYNQIGVEWLDNN